GQFLGSDRAQVFLRDLALRVEQVGHRQATRCVEVGRRVIDVEQCDRVTRRVFFQDRKSTRLNSSHVKNSYAVFCLKKKKCAQQGIVFRGESDGVVFVGQQVAWVIEGWRVVGSVV